MLQEPLGMVPDGHSGISPTAFGVCLPMAVERHPPTRK